MQQVIRLEYPQSQFSFSLNLYVYIITQNFKIFKLFHFEIFETGWLTCAFIGLDQLAETKEFTYNVAPPLNHGDFSFISNASYCQSSRAKNRSLALFTLKRAVVSRVSLLSYITTKKSSAFLVPNCFDGTQIHLTPSSRDIWRPWMDSNHRCPQARLLSRELD